MLSKDQLQNQIDFIKKEKAKIFKKKSEKRLFFEENPHLTDPYHLIPSSNTQRNNLHKFRSRKNCCNADL